METVPKREIEKRISRFQAQLAAANLDGAFIVQNADLFYFSGTIQTAVLFVPSNGDPILMVQENHARAQFESSLNHVISVKNKNRIPQVLNDFKLDQLAAAGIEMDVLPANLYLWFQRTLPQCRWTDVSGIIRKLRMLKSVYESEQIEKAAAILHTGLTQIKCVIREGMTELEIDGHLAMIARREGHMGALRMRGWNQEMSYAHVLSGGSGSAVSLLNSPHGGTGNTPAMAQGAGSRRIKKMVLALEPKFVFPQKGVVGLEDDYPVTPNGLKRLTRTDQTLIQI